MNILHNRRRMMNAVVATAFLLSGALLAYLGEQLVSKLHLETSPWLLFIAFLFALIVFAVMSDVAMQRAGRVLGSTVKVSMPDQEQPRRFFLTGYSPLPTEKADKVLRNARGMSLEELRADKEAVEKRNLPNLGSWHQNARALLFHASRLEAILILRPDERDEVFERFVQFLQICLEKAGNDKTIIRQIHFPGNADRQFQMLGRTGVYEPPSYEDYEYVYEGFREGLKQLREINGAWSEDDVCIDVTPGLKPYSIAAAVITFNQGLKFSYVNMDGHIRFYDAQITFHA